MFMALDTFIDTEQTIKRTRRIFAPEFKQHLVELCQQPDTSDGQGSNATSDQCQSAA